MWRYPLTLSFPRRRNPSGHHARSNLAKGGEKLVGALIESHASSSTHRPAESRTNETSSRACCRSKSDSLITKDGQTLIDSSGSGGSDSAGVHLDRRQSRRNVDRFASRIVGTLDHQPSRSVVRNPLGTRSTKRSLAQEWLAVECAIKPSGQRRGCGKRSSSVMLRAAKIARPRFRLVINGFCQHRPNLTLPMM